MRCTFKRLADPVTAFAQSDTRRTVPAGDGAEPDGSVRVRRGTGNGLRLGQDGSFSQAVAIAREFIAAHPDIITSYRYLAAWSAMNGDPKTARWAAQKLLAAQPSFTIERSRSLPVFHNTPDRAYQVAEGLELAGLPER
ncbi:hypothetical protein MesoLj113a_65410 [Mesorhizobium sp. 113-1-2]|nr:hypothetical protein MesoLj113a_65410 [Mesorhizobium sp. 113-1-2]